MSDILIKINYLKREVNDPNSHLEVKVYDWDRFLHLIFFFKELTTYFRASMDDFMGDLSIPLEHLQDEEVVQRWYNLEYGRIRLEFQFEHPYARVKKRNIVRNFKFSVCSCSSYGCQRFARRKTDIDW